MGSFVDWVTNPVGTFLGKTSQVLGKATGSQTLDSVGRFAEDPTGTTVNSIPGIGKNPQTMSIGGDLLPPPPTPDNAGEDMEEAAQQARNRRGMASTYLVPRGSSLLDQPGTFFKNSLGT